MWRSSWDLTPYLHLVLWLCVIVAIATNLLPQYAFMAWTGTFYFFYTWQRVQRKGTIQFNPCIGSRPQRSHISLTCPVSHTCKGQLRLSQDLGFSPYGLEEECRWFAAAYYYLFQDVIWWPYNRRNKKISNCIPAGWLYVYRKLYGTGGFGIF